MYKKYFNKYNKLKESWDINNINIQNLLELAWWIIDEWYYNKDVKLSTLWIEIINNYILTKEKNINKIQKAQCYYFIWNSYSDQYEINNINENNLYSNIDYYLNEYEQAIYYYRLTLSIKEIENLSIKYECLINLANIYSHLWRFIKSVELYDIVINKGYENQLAYGNIWLAIYYYWSYLYDEWHQKYFAYFSFKYLEKSLKFTTTDVNAYNKFQNYYNNLIKSGINEVKYDDLNLEKHNLWKTKSEKEYRKWCIENKLFLNDFNDLWNYNIWWNDIIHLPNMITKIDEENYFISLYNQIKQEYISSRYFLYEWIKWIWKTHFSDKESLLINTLDYPRYSINIERIKTSYKTLYSIFDKVAYFLNKYFELWLDNDSVDFRTVWYTNKYEKEINPVILSKRNHLLRWIFLISKDLLFHKWKALRSEEIQEINKFQNSVNPSAKKLNIIRNHLEHKFIKVYDDMVNKSNYKDNISYPIKENELIESTIHLISLVRETLIWLSLMINIEEKKKDVWPMVAPIYLDTFLDDFKY